MKDLEKKLKFCQVLMKLADEKGHQEFKKGSGVYLELDEDDEDYDDGGYRITTSDGLYITSVESAEELLKEIEENSIEVDWKREI